jgi:predicted Fe-S protein YdhL (DUF1289 family)
MRPEIGAVRYSAQRVKWSSLSTDELRIVFDNCLDEREKDLAQKLKLFERNADLLLRQPRQRYSQRSFARGYVIHWDVRHSLG